MAGQEAVNFGWEGVFRDFRKGRTVHGWPFRRVACVQYYCEEEKGFLRVSTRELVVAAKATEQQWCLLQKRICNWRSPIA